jgi:hypothetical protein
VGRPGGLRRSRRGGLVAGHGDLLRRGRRVRDNGRRVRVRQPVQRRVRRQQRGAEHGAVQRRRVVRAVLHHHVRRLTAGRPVLQARQQRHRHGHQPVPAKLRAAQRRLVRPGAPPLRHGAAGVGAHRHRPGRHHPGHVPAGQVLAQRRRALRRRRLQLLPARQHPEPRRQRLRGGGMGKGRQDWLDPDVKELGCQLAGARRARRPGAQLRRDQHRRAVHPVPKRGAGVVAVRPDLHHLPTVRLLIHRLIGVVFCDLFPVAFVVSSAWRVVSAYVSSRGPVSAPTHGGRGMLAVRSSIAYPYHFFPIWYHIYIYVKLLTLFNHEL